MDESRVPRVVSIELRCGGRLHGKISETRIEVKCRSASCGARAGVVVLHTFALGTGELIETIKFADPATKLKEEEREHAHCV